MPKPGEKKESVKTFSSYRASTASSRAKAVNRGRQKREDRLEERRGRKDRRQYKVESYSDEEVIEIPNPNQGSEDEEDVEILTSSTNPIVNGPGVTVETIPLAGTLLDMPEVSVETVPLHPERHDPSSDSDDERVSEPMNDLLNADLKGKQQMTEYKANLRFYEGEQLQTLRNDMIAVYSPVQTQVDAFKSINIEDLRRGIDLLKGRESVPRVKIEELETQYHDLVENRNYIVQEVDDIQNENNQLIKVAIDPAAAERGERAFRGDLQADRNSIVEWIRPRALKVCMIASKGLKAGFSLASAIGSLFNGEFVGAITKGVEFGGHMADLVKIWKANLEQTEQLRQEIFGVSQNTQALVNDNEQRRRQYAEQVKRENELRSDIATTQTTLDVMRNQNETLAIEYRKNNDDINNNLQLIQTNGIRTQEQLSANSQSLVAIQDTINQVIPAVRNVGKVVSLVNSISKNLNVVNNISTQVIQNMPTNAQQEAFFNQVQTTIDEFKPILKNTREEFQQLIPKIEETTIAMGDQVIRAVGDLQNTVIEHARAYPEQNQQVIQHINATTANLRKLVVEDLSKQLQEFVDASGKVNSNQLSTVVYKTDETALSRFNELVQRRLDGLQMSVLEQISANQVVLPAAIEQSLGVRVDEVINIMKGFPDAMAVLQEYVAERQMAIEARQEATNRLLVEMQNAITSMVASNEKERKEFYEKLSKYKMFRGMEGKIVDHHYKGEPAHQPLAAISSAYDVTDPSGIINPDNLRRLLNLIDRLTKGLKFDLPYAIVTNGLKLPPTTTDEELYRHFKSLRAQGSKMSTRTHGRAYIAGKHIDPFIQPDYNEKREKEIRTNRLRRIEKRQKKDEADMYGGFFRLL